jgi:hypothetical protein
VGICTEFITFEKVTNVEIAPPQYFAPKSIITKSASPLKTEIFKSRRVAVGF